MKVIIDNIEYVPINTVVPTDQTMMKELLHYFGYEVEDIREYNLGLYITEGRDTEDKYRIDHILADIIRHHNG